MYERLNIARKARNDFAHRGLEPTEDDATAALNGFFSLASLVSSSFEDENAFSAVTVMALQMTNPAPRADERGKLFDEPVAWRPIPPVPGDSHWPSEESYEVVEELRFKKLDELA